MSENGKRNVIVVLSAALLCGSVSAAAAQAGDGGYSRTFFGLSTELTLLPLSEPWSAESLAVESVCLNAAFGDRGFLPYPPLRARGGLGFWPGRYFVAKLGAEIAVLEILNSMRGRMFGLYAYADGILRLGADGIELALEPSVRALLPLSPIGGLALGIGYDTGLGWTIHLDYLAGFYAIR